jgi:hypothetical protein
LTHLGKLGVKVGGLLKQFEDTPDPGQVESCRRQLRDLPKPVDVACAVAAGAAGTADRFEEALAFICAKRLRVKAAQLGRNRDAEQAATGFNPFGVHNHRPVESAR